MEILIGVFLFVRGLYSFYAIFKNKKTIHLESPSTTYLQKKIFGKSFNRWHNFFWGTTEFIVGITLLIHFLR